MTHRTLTFMLHKTLPQISRWRRSPATGSLASGLCRCLDVRDHIHVHMLPTSRRCQYLPLIHEPTLSISVQFTSTYVPYSPFVIAVLGTSEYALRIGCDVRAPHYGVHRLLRVASTDLRRSLKPESDHGDVGSPDQDWKTHVNPARSKLSFHPKHRS